jgi:hypothetical protein
VLRQALEFPSSDFSREDYEAAYDEYRDFLDFLSEIVVLPKNKKVS